MRKIFHLIIAMLTISLWSCVADRKYSTPKGFECFNQPRVYIKYNQKVNGYTVKAMWLPYTNDSMTVETGISTILHFSNDSNEFSINLEAKTIIDTACYNYENLKDGDVLYWDYTPNDTNAILPHYTPFSFADVDFDGEEELVILNYQNGTYCYNTYKIYKVHQYYAEEMTEPPFKDIEDSSVFDYENKTITTFLFGGFGNYTSYVYKPIEYETMYGDEPITVSKFELVEANVKDDLGLRTYQRIGNRLELVKQEQIE